jgi:signal transduction histidine kinase
MYFWSNICTPDVMDYSAEFARNSSDIVGERILLCDTLAALDNDRALEYKEERESLTRKLIVQKMASWINATKIYVETDQVRHKLIDSFQEKYQIYKALPERKSSDEISYVTTRIFDFELSTPLKTKDRLLLEMYDYARDVFLRDEKYGLDVALSVEIRHGGLDHITVPLEAGKLLTRRNLQGRYESNMYWNNKYQIYKEGVLKKLDQSLSEFSRKIDRLIDDLKNKILQINYNASRDEVAIFNYDVDDLQLRCIGEQVSRTRNVSEMVDVLINELWDCTDVNLKKAQQYFQSDVRIHVDVIVDELLQQLRLIRGGSGFVELEQTIGSARGNLHTAIDESAGWFKRVTEAELDDCDISVAINVAIDSVQAIYSHKNTHFVIESHCDDVFDGKESRILVNILLILLNNAVKHSGYDVNVPPVTIKIERDNSVLMLSVVNDIGGGVVMEAVVDKLDKAKCDISVGKYSQYTTSEGGSGFYKIAKMVEVDVGGKLSMDYCIQNREISVTIKIDGGLSGASAYC